MDEVAKLATTASVLVANGASAAVSFNDLGMHTTFQGINTAANGYSKNGLIGLLAKHGDDLKALQSLKRTNIGKNGKRKKDFNVLSNELLHEIPKSDDSGNDSREASNDPETDTKPFSLFQGFSAVLPEIDDTIQNIMQNSGKMLTQDEQKPGHRPNVGRIGNKRPNGNATEITSDKIKVCQNRRVLLNFKSDINYNLDLIEIRKGLSMSEIIEIDKKIDRLYNLRKEIHDNIKFYENSSKKLEEHLIEIEERLDYIKDIDLEDEEEQNSYNDTENDSNNNNNNDIDNDIDDDNDVNGPLTIQKRTTKRIEKTKTKTNTATSTLRKVSRKISRRVSRSIHATTGDVIEDESDYVTEFNEVQHTEQSDPDADTSYSRITHRHLKPGDLIHRFQAHHDSISCLGFDVPYGRLVTCSTDNTVKLWDLSRYKCYGLLEGHNAYVNCVSVNENLAFTGGLDATVKVWDLDYYDDLQEETRPMLNSFEGHVDSITALTYNNGELVSGSNDKTIRQWDLTTGHLLQTIDVMWASSMANSMINFGTSEKETKKSTVIDTTYNHPFISSLQVFDAALASGSSDGIVRLWDLRSGEVIRQLFGHTGAVTTIQFDKSFNLVSGSADRSVRVWDLRTGGLVDSYSYDHCIQKIAFDEVKIASLVQDEGIRVYDRSEERHWSLDSEATAVTDMSLAGNYLVSGDQTGSVGIFCV